MKKILLSVAAIFAAMSMNAQEICTLNADNALSLDSENGTPLTAGTVIGETESIVATVGADDTYKPQNVAATANDQEIKGGLQGGTNPKDADGSNPATSLSAPVSGAYLQFEAKADGFLYVIHKASSNKNYTVFEEGTAIGYTYSAIGDATTLLGAVYGYTLVGEGELNEIKTPIEWAEQEYLKQADPEAYEANFTVAEDGTKTWNKIGKGGIGVIAFPVYAECKYIVNACGSKITAGGFVFSTDDNVTIKSDDVTIYAPGGAPEPEPVGEVELELTEGHTLLISTIEAAGGTDDDTVVFHIQNNSADSREGWGIGGFANSDNWTPIVEWTGMAGSEWTYEYPVSKIKEVAGDTAGQYHGIGITINIYNDCKVSKVTLVSGATAISSAKIAQADGPIYNLSGQKVNASYKGLVIMGGKKYIQK